MLRGRMRRGGGGIFGERWLWEVGGGLFLLGFLVFELMLMLMLILILMRSGVCFDGAGEKELRRGVEIVVMMAAAAVAS